MLVIKIHLHLLKVALIFLSKISRCVDCYKRNKKTYSSCIVELHKYLGTFKNTREVREATLFCS